MCVCVSVLFCGGVIWNYTSYRTELEEHLVHVGENVILPTCTSVNLLWAHQLLFVRVWGGGGGGGAIDIRLSIFRGKNLA